jgi:hypothetical protein
MKLRNNRAYYFNAPEKNYLLVLWKSEKLSRVCYDYGSRNNDFYLTDRKALDQLFQLFRRTLNKVYNLND